MTSSLPAGQLYGTVTGKFGIILGDTTADPDEYPDEIPASGSITFRPNASFIKIPGATPQTDLPQPITVPLAPDGAIRGPYGDINHPPGVALLSPSAPGVNPQDYTITVEFNFNGNVKLPSFDIDFAPGETVDLTSAAPVPSASGTFYLQGPPGAPGVNQPPEGTPDGWAAVAANGQVAYVPPATAGDVVYFPGAAATYTGSAGDVETALRQLDTALAGVVLNGGGGGGGGGLTIVGPDANGVLTATDASGGLVNNNGVISYTPA
jgi:hypothetical protein